MSIANDELWKLDATARAALVAAGEVNALELLEAAIARIEALEPTVHVLAGFDFEAARDRARPSPSGPLGGVPFLVKDLIAYPGLRHSMGSRLFSRNVATDGSPYSQALDAAGLIVLGKTTMSELGLLGMAKVPAMSVPLHVSDEGWPIGMHFAAPFGREATLLELAYELEEAAPWRDRFADPASRA